MIVVNGHSLAYWREEKVAYDQKKRGESCVSSFNDLADYGYGILKHGVSSVSPGETACAKGRRFPMVNLLTF